MNYILPGYIFRIPADCCALYFAQFMTAFGFALALPLIPLAALKLGATASEVAFIMGSNAIVFLILAPILGAISDKVGRKAIIIFAYSVSCLSFYVLSVSDNITTLLIARAVGGVHGACGGVIMAYVSDCVSKEDSAEIMGFMSSAITLGFILGPLMLVGGALADVVNGAGLFIAAAGGIMIGAVVFAFAQKRVTSQEVTPKTEPSKGIMDKFAGLRAHTGVLVFVGATSLVWLFYAGRTSTISLFILDLNPDSVIVKSSIFYILASFVTVVSQVWIISYLNNRNITESFILCASLIASVLAISSLYFYNWLFMLLFYLILAVLTAVAYPAAMSLVAKRSLRHQKGTLLSLAASTVNLGQAAGPFIMGIGLVGVGMRGFGLLEGVGLLVCAVAFEIGRRKKWLKL